MKGYFYFCICFLAIVVVFAKTNVVKSNSENSEILNINVPNFNEFDWRLCKALHEVETNNAVVSSISVKLVLLMLYEGALGSTANQIEQVIGLTGDKQSIRNQYHQKLKSLQVLGKNDYEMDIGTKLFMDISVNPKNEFLNSTSQWYNTTYEKVNFRKPIDAVTSINQWANQITHGRIQKLISEAETKENTLLLLLNAVYFKGYWTNPFNANFTMTGTFHLNSKTKIDVPLMTTYGSFKISNSKSLNARLISLPYAGNKFVMYIILPNSFDGLDDLVNMINPSLLGESIKNMKSFSTKLVLPKFNFEYTSILGPILQKLGITDMFGLNANLTNMGNVQGDILVVSNVLQKAGLEVNEDGSVAYATTEVDLDHRFGVPINAEFEVNRPFLFMIQDITTDTIIFVGQVTNPRSHGEPVVSIPIVNTPTPISPGMVTNFKINSEQDVGFQRFSYFDSELFQELCDNQQEINFVVSPVSIKSILSVLREGADGDTQKQLNHVLRLPDDLLTLHNLLRTYQMNMKSNIIDLVVVNNIFVKNKTSLSTSFKDIATDLYSANIFEINFLNIGTSIKMINEQISTDTKGLIDNAISKDDFDRNTELLLANVIYFKGNWLVEFNENDTKMQCFYTEPNKCVSVKMMYVKYKFKYGYIEDIKSHAIELLYKDTNFSMVILLPDENNTMTQLLKDLTFNPLPKIVDSLRNKIVNLYLPRFSINFSTKLSTVLKKMGLTSIFDSSANLSSMFNSPKEVFVKDVIHKVTIEVNEKGSTASALTVVSVIPLSGQPKLPPVTLNVNRPFVFFIINRATKSTLFSGQIHSINNNNNNNNNNNDNVLNSTNVSQRVNFNVTHTNYAVPNYQQTPNKN